MATVDTETGEIVAPVAAHQLVLPTFDGLDVKTYEFRFAGNVPMVMGFELDDAFIARCRLGARLRFKVDAVVSARTFKVDELGGFVAGGGRLKVESIDLEEVEERS